MDFYLWKGNKAPEGFSQFTVRKLRGEPQVFQGDAVFPSDYYDVYNDHYGFDDNDDYDDYNYYAVLALRSRFRDLVPIGTNVQIWSRKRPDLCTESDVLADSDYLSLSRYLSFLVFT